MASHYGSRVDRNQPPSHSQSGFHPASGRCAQKPSKELRQGRAEESWQALKTSQHLAKPLLLQGNFLARVVFPERIQRFNVEVDLIAEMTVINPFDFFLEPYAEKFPFQYEGWLEQELAPFRGTRMGGPWLYQMLETIDRSPRRAMDFLGFPGRAKPTAAEGDSLSHPARARRADQRRDARAEKWFLPR